MIEYGIQIRQVIKDYTRTSCGQPGCGFDIYLKRAFIVEPFSEGL